MTVKELKEKIKDIPDDAEVLVCGQNMEVVYVIPFGKSLFQKFVGKERIAGISFESAEIEGFSYRIL